MTRTLNLAAACLVVTTATPSTVWSQPRSHAFGAVSARANDAVGGVSVGIGPIAVDGEFGVGPVLLGAAGLSLTPLTDRRVRPFVRGGFTTVGSSEFDAQGVHVGGGILWWRGRIGVRAEAFRFFALRTERVAQPPPPLARVHYWGVRLGVAFGF